MTNFSNLFPSTHCNREYVEGMDEETAANGYKEIHPDQTGYALVNKRLVPFTFVNRVKNELEGIQFEYGFVMNERQIFSDAFLKSLDKDERKVLMPCVLILIERGDFELNLFESRAA